jgi:predicted HAD superfamily Cof-like phosphohydrolase
MHFLGKNSKTIEQSVKEFHEKYGHYSRTYPSTAIIPDAVKKLRIALIREEIEELLKAMEENDLVEIGDGGADSIYVIVGTMIAYGIPIDRIFAEVHNSNMTKTAVKAENGEKYGTKTPKGPDYRAPDVHGILFRPENPTLLEIANRPKEN